MDAKATKLINMVLQWEGGYSDPSYDGHETYRGITRGNHRTWAGWKIIDANKPLKYNQIIKNAKLEEDVREFYYKNYYTPMKIGSLNDLLTSGQVFAMGVNGGIKTAIQLLQKAINKVYGVKIATDGIIGNITLQYANGDKSKQVGQEMINQCNARYDSIVAKNPSKKKFLNGWKNRVKGVTATCTSSNVLLTSSIKEGWFTKLMRFILDLIKLFKK